VVIGISDRVEVTVPATSANLGPGFDCLGIALTIENRYTFLLSDEGVVISGCPEAFCNPDHMTVRAFHALYLVAGQKPPAFRLHLDSKIPIARGLGSSAACILAGLAAANRFLGNRFSEEKLFDLACRLEGHPDNIAPALFGGFCAGLYDDRSDRFLYRKFAVPHFPHLYALVPDFCLSTTRARSALPNTYSKEDMIATIQHLVWLLGNLTQNKRENFAAGFEDCVHHPYRGPLIPDWETIRRHLSQKEDCAVTISGSGPTLLVWVEDARRPIAPLVEELAPVLKAKWEVLPCALNVTGLRIASWEE